MYEKECWSCNYFMNDTATAQRSGSSPPCDKCEHGELWRPLLVQEVIKFRKVAESRRIIKEGAE